MSREYLLKVFLDEKTTTEKLYKFLVQWCGREQIYRVTTESFICEMGCSSGVAPEDTMNELYNQLIDAGFKVNREDIIVWSLHPDNAITIGG